MSAITNKKCAQYIVHIVFVFSLLLQADALKAGDNLTVSAPPSIWVHQQEGQLTGPIIDLVKDIFAEFGVTVTSVPLPWARAITQIKSGKLDMIPVIFYTEERADFMEFSIPFAVVPTSVFVPAGKSFPYASITDLADKNGLIMRGDSISPEFETHKATLDVSEVAGYGQMIRMLADHRADYAAAAQYGFIIQAKQMKSEKKLEMLPQPIASRPLHFAFSKKSPYKKYLPLINQKLKTLEANGRLKRLVNDTIDKAAEK